MKPPYTLTHEILNLCTEITLLLGKYEGLPLPVPQPELRKHNRIRTIQSSLAIEGNTLTIEQVTDIINNKRVIGPSKDILEVKNAIKAYENLSRYKVGELDSLLLAHKTLMHGLIQEAGKLRSSNVGVRKGEKVIHMAPNYTQVPKLMEDLFLFLKKEKDSHPLIKSSAFHYELEFIHPFIDGNGRIGRLWQSAILYNYRSIFEYVPIESVIRKKQAEYYECLHECDKAGESTIFIKFILTAIKEAVIEFAKQVRPQRQSTSSRVNIAKEKFGKKPFTRKDYLETHGNISTATASRDLAMAVSKKMLKKIGDKAITMYQFIE